MPELKKEELKRCTHCAMPSTWSGISFDKDGVCSLCQEYRKFQKVNWKQRQGILKNVLKFYKRYAWDSRNKYDCIVGFSGGKDSTYTLWAAKRKYGMSPLAVTFDHGFKLTPEGEYNMQEMPKLLDVDHLRFSIGNGLRNALCRKASEVMGDFCWHCHNGVGAFPARVSKMFDIPLQIWGEPTALYGTFGHYLMEDMEEQDENHFKKMFQAEITPEMVKPEGYDLVDLMPMTWPEDEFNLKALYLGNFEPWDNQEEHVKIIKEELGWKDYPKQETWQSWDKNDCPMELVREAQKKLRRGFGKASFAASKEIRTGKISRAQGMKLIKEYENKELVGLNELCQEMGLKSFEELKEITNLNIK